jgi:HAD superfamily hydrolase (TIGR01509 family)
MSNIKLVIFDLDGTLIESTKELHYEALNKALYEISPNFIINKKEHEDIYDALSTKQKLHLLTLNKGLNIDHHDKINKRKQEITFELLKNHIFNIDRTEFLKDLKNEGFKIAICTNSIKKTTGIILEKLGITELVDIVFTNEDVTKPKPDQEIFNKAINYFNIEPNECIIYEDSKYGIEAAEKTGAFLRVVKDVDKLNTQTVKKDINDYNIKNMEINILIPMSGKGSRFLATHKEPKPLIKIKENLTMIELVVKNLNIKGNYIFIVLKEHYEKYDLHNVLTKTSSNVKIVIVDSVTEGACCTSLLAKDIINNDTPIFIANSDQYVEDWNPEEFFYKIHSNNLDGGIVTFRDTDPKWSFAKIDENGIVTEVAEKRQISDISTVGFYYWVKGSDYVKYAEQMINKNIRVNGEFFIAPVYNEAIIDNKKFTTFDIKKMFGLGIPNDLQIFLNSGLIY